MSSWEIAGRSLDAVTAQAHSWAADAALIIIALAAGGSIMTAMILAARRLLGMGATPDQVGAILDRKINGGLVRIEAKLDRLDERVDARHEENVDRMSGIEGRLSALEIVQRGWRQG